MGPSKDELTFETLNKFGFQTLGRMNLLHPPFDNVKVPRAALLAMNQKDVLDALVGNPKYYKICGAVFVCDTPLATDVGSESLVKGNGMAEAKKLLAESRYDGTPIVLMAPGGRVLAGVRINPPKSHKVTFPEDDQIVVLAAN